MKFIFTMNMPSGSGNLVHQVIGEHPAADCKELLEHMVRSEFILIRQYYQIVDHATNERTWDDKGDMILNTYHVGKVQVYVKRGNTR